MLFGDWFGEAQWELPPPPPSPCIGSPDDLTVNKAIRLRGCLPQQKKRSAEDQRDLDRWIWERLWVGSRWLKVYFMHIWSDIWKFDIDLHGICMIYLFCDLCYHYKAVRVCRVMCHHPSKTWQGHFKSCLQVFLRSKYHAEAQRHRKTPANEPLAWLIGVHDILTFFTFHLFVFIIGNYGFQSLPQFLGLLLFLQVAVEGERCWIWIKLKDHIYPPLFNICLNYKQNIKNKGWINPCIISTIYFMISWYHTF